MLCYAARSHSFSGLTRVPWSFPLLDAFTFFNRESLTIKAERRPSDRIDLPSLQGLTPRHFPLEEK